MRKRTVTVTFFPVLVFLVLGVLTPKFTVEMETSSSTATVYVDPATSVEAVAQNFTVNIGISNVTDLYGWEFKLGWNTTVLDVVEVYEGNFLKSSGDTFFTYKINNTAGYIIVDCTLLGDVPGVSGNGTLATIKFHVKNVGECTLDLYDTILISSAEQSIEHTTMDGYFYTLVRDVAVINLVASETTVNVTVENQGNYYMETFNISAYYTILGDPLIGTQTVTLEPGANTTLVFVWAPPTSGRYEILAEASVVPGEADITDNARTITIIIGGSSGGSSAVGYRRALK